MSETVSQAVARVQAPAEMIAEIPASCTCFWVHSARWVRVGPKEDCPWHTWETPWSAERKW
jgi:hypothetical protein